MINDKWFNDKFPLIALSPLDGITDESYRLVQAAISKPDVIFTEFVSAEGLAHGAVKLFDHLLYSPIERPIIAQLFGKDPDSFRLAAQILCLLGFDGIDINFGCPAKTVTQHGSGAAIISNYDLAAQIIAAVKSGIASRDIKLKPKTEKIINRNNLYSNNPTSLRGGHPTKQSRRDRHGLRPRDDDSISLSVKTRLGLDAFNPDWFTFLDSQGLDFISVHGRTLRQGYSGLADWQAISRIVASSKTPIWGNGDLQSRAQAVEYCRKYGTTGALIGRASMGNPWVFADTTPTFVQKFDTMVLHARKFVEIFPDRRFDVMRKHFLLYSSGHPRAKYLRSRLVAINNLADLLSLEAEFKNC